MKHLKKYKLFEELTDTSIFPEYHRLAGKDVNKVLKEIYNQLPQEEITHQKEDWIESYGEESYKTMVDVDGIRVSLKVCKAPFLPIATISIDRYQVGAKLFSLKLFNRLKKLYNDLFKEEVTESTAYDDMKNIIEDASSICDDIRDDGFVVDVKPDNDIHIKMLGMYRRGTITTSHNKIEITISKSVFWFADIQETIGRLVGYMESENFSCDVDFVTEIANRAASVSMRRPISKKVKYKEFVKLFGGGIEPWNTQAKPARQSSNKLSSIKLIFEVDSLYLLDVINKRKD